MNRTFKLRIDVLKWMVTRMAPWKSVDRLGDESDPVAQLVREIRARAPDPRSEKTIS